MHVSHVTGPNLYDAGVVGTLRYDFNALFPRIGGCHVYIGRVEQRASYRSSSASSLTGAFVKELGRLIVSCEFS